MALKDKISLGLSLPHRSPEPIEMSVVRQVAQRGDALGFRDLWVTENTLDHVFSFDPVVILTHAAAVTTKIRVGVSVAVLPVQNPIHVAHQFATLDYASNGRAILGVGLGRDQHYPQFQVPREHRIRRFREQLELIKALWTAAKVSYKGTIYQLDAGAMSPRPVQKPHPPIWFGGGHPDAIRRAAAMADGWMGAGGSTNADFKRSVPLPASISRRRGATRRRFRSRSGCSCPCTSAPTPHARSCTAGTASFTITRRAPTPPAFTARPSKSASAWKSWSPRARTIFCSTPSPATRSTSRRSRRSRDSPERLEQALDASQDRAGEQRGLVRREVDPDRELTAGDLADLGRAAERQHGLPRPGEIGMRQQQQAAAQITIHDTRRREPRFRRHACHLFGTQEAPRCVHLPHQGRRQAGSRLVQRANPVAAGDREEAPIGVAEAVRSVLVFLQED